MQSDYMIDDSINISRMLVGAEKTKQEPGKMKTAF